MENVLGFRNMQEKLENVHSSIYIFQKEEKRICTMILIRKVISHLKHFSFFFIVAFFVEFFQVFHIHLSLSLRTQLPTYLKPPHTWSVKIDIS